MSESKDVGTLLRWLTGTSKENDTPERAREAAVRLGKRAYETLAVGLTTTRSASIGPPPARPTRTLESR